MTAGITNPAALPQLESGALSVSARGFGWKHADRQQAALHALDLEIPAGSGCCCWDQRRGQIHAAARHGRGPGRFRAGRGAPGQLLVG
ncbi:hypothetical protein, partial [Arthrobacter sp. JCM 19049]|uniref:hypothetical protein n=1 Tax=Arthrobacter sp. JCM 19049 TaxID=1460643 RepID=UPI000A4C6AE5